MARARISKSRKAVAGTVRLDRLGNPGGGDMVNPLEKLPKPPESLSNDAKAAWKEFGDLAISLGTLSHFDTGLLELLARTWASCVELEALLAQDGLVLVSGSVRKAHPGLQALDRARALAHRLLGDLGLTPPSRERVSINPNRGERKPKPWEDDPAGKYFRT
jgi:P27 family predicted phage terminase small subunit